MPRTPLACLLLVVLAVALPSQSTHLVGPGGFPDIQAAVDAASPGDRVHVQSGTYLGFTCSKALRIRALGPVTLGLNVLQPGHVSLSPPAGATVDLVGFEMMRLTLSSGRATIDTCTIGSGVQAQNAQLHLQDTLVIGASVGGAPGLDAQQASITAVGCTFVDSPTSFWTDGPVVRVVDGRLHASDCGLMRGNFWQGVGSYLEVGSGATVWLADSHVDGSPPNHCPFDVAANATLRADRTTWSTATAGCATPVPGLLLGVERPAPLLVGQGFDVGFRTVANGFVAVFAGPALGETSWGPLLEQPSWLDDTQSFAVTLLLADQSGDAQASFAIPSGAAIYDQALWFKGIGGVGLPLQVSPPIGGVAR